MTSTEDVQPDDTGTDDPAPAPDPTPEQTATAEAIVDRVIDALDNYAAIAGSPRYIVVTSDEWGALEAAGLDQWLALRESGRVRQAADPETNTGPAE